MAHEELSTERAEEIASQSPEGAPANPDLGSGTLILLTLMFPIAVLIASGVVWLILGAMPALVTLSIGLFVCVIANPTLWATLNRAKERKRVEQSN